MLTGKLIAYWEQGWEGRVEYFFEPADSKDNTELVPLAAGYSLTVLGPDNTPVWMGEIDFVSRHRWFGLVSEKHGLDCGIWNDFKQRGVSYGDWISWFWNKAPAELTIPRQPK